MGDDRISADAEISSADAGSRIDSARISPSPVIVPALRTSSNGGDREAPGGETEAHELDLAQAASNVALAEEVFDQRIPAAETALLDPVASRTPENVSVPAGESLKMVMPSGLSSIDPPPVSQWKRLPFAKSLAQETQAAPPAATSPIAQSKRPWVLRAGIIAGMALLGASIWYSGPAAVAAQVLSVGWKLPLILLPSMLFSISDGFGWWYAIAPPRRPFRLFDAVVIRAAAASLESVSVAFAGDAIRISTMLSKGFDRTRAASSVIVGRASEIVSLGIFLLVVLPVTLLALPPAAGPLPKISTAAFSAVLLALGVGLIYWLRSGFFRPLLGLGRALARWRNRLVEGAIATAFGAAVGWIKKIRKPLSEIDDAVRNFLREHRRGFALSLAAHFIGWLALAFEVGVLLYALGIPLNPVHILLIAGLLPVVSSATSFIPGSVGAVETATVLIFSWLGMGSATALAFALLRRFRQVFWAILSFAVLGRLALLRKNAKDSR